MKKAVAGFIMAMLILAWFIPAWGAQTSPDCRIVFLATGQASRSQSQQILKLMHHHFNEFSRIRVSLASKTADADFFSVYDRQGERQIKKTIEAYQCDYLFFMRKIGQNDFSFEIWSADLIFDHIYLPYNDNMEKFLPDIAANSFLSLLYGANERFWKSRRY